MRVPGSNILNKALSVIYKQPITYFASSGRTLNDLGQNVTHYDLPKAIVGSFQPVPRSLYEQLGLDLQKAYFNLYTSNDVIDVSRDVSGDQIVYQGTRYQCESNTQWFGIDGWVAVLCVETVQPVPTVSIFGFNSGTYPNWDNSNTNFGNGNFAPGGEP